VWETENLPSLRRIITFDAYIEGWAKYAEIIPTLNGINTDPKFPLALLDPIVDRDIQRLKKQL